MALMCSGVQKKSHFYSMPPLHRATAKDGEKAAKSCPCRAVGAVEAPPPEFGTPVDPISSRGKKVCPPHYYLPSSGFSDLPTALLGLQNCSGILYLNFC